MRRFALLFAGVLAFSLCVMAQGTSASGTQTQSKTTKSKSEKTAAAGEAKTSQLTGCLAKDASGNGYTLTNGRYKKGVAVTSSQDISAHVGHEVRLMGTWEKPGTAFTATDLKHIADTCTPAGGKKAEKAEGTATKK